MSSSAALASARKRRASLASQTQQQLRNEKIKQQESLRRRDSTSDDVDTPPKQEKMTPLVLLKQHEQKINEIQIQIKDTNLDWTEACETLANKTEILENKINALEQMGSNTNGDIVSNQPRGEVDTKEPSEEVAGIVTVDGMVDEETFVTFKSDVESKFTAFDERALDITHKFENIGSLVQSEISTSSVVEDVFQKKLLKNNDYFEGKIQDLNTRIGKDTRSIEEQQANISSLRSDILATFSDLTSKVDSVETVNVELNATLSGAMERVSKTQRSQEDVVEKLDLVIEENKYLRETIKRLDGVLDNLRQCIIDNLMKKTIFVADQGEVPQDVEENSKKTEEVKFSVQETDNTEGVDNDSVYSEVEEL